MTEIIPIRNPAVAELDRAAEVAQGRVRTPNRLTDDDLAQFGTHAGRVRTLAGQDTLSAGDQEFIQGLHAGLRPPSGSTSRILAERVGDAQALTSRRSLARRWMNNVLDGLLSLFGQGHRIESWWRDGDQIRSRDDRALQEQASEFIRDLSPAQRDEIMRPEFAAELRSELEGNGRYRALGRDSGEDAAGIHAVLQNQIVLEAEQARQAAEAAEAAADAAREATRRQPGPLSELPPEILEHPLYSNSDRAFQIWFQNGWETIPTDEMRRNILELAGGRPPGSNGQVGLVEQWAHTAPLIEAAGFTSLGEFLNEMQGILEVRQDGGKYGGETWQGHLDHRERIGNPNASLIDILDHHRGAGS
ncbi:MAG: hypothetical protein AAFX94_02350 [Myxococcota bacterium]